MISINLLPYREARRRQQILQHLIVAVGLFAIIFVMIAAGHLYYTNILDTKREETASLQAENRALAKKIGKIKNFDKLKKDVESKLNLVDRLQKSRFRSLGRLISLSESIPENIWLNTISDQGNSMKLSGFGESNKAVANFMRSIDQSSTYNDVRLEVIRRIKIGDVPVREFILTMSMPEQEKQKKINKPVRSGGQS
ncbi:MAG: PilN domain-containing protein [Mariprofundaceae bacterium]